jgi:hypothetical protein
MTDLLDDAVAAHGGADHFNQLRTISADLVTGGTLEMLKGQSGVLNTSHVSIDLHQKYVLLLKMR